LYLKAAYYVHYAPTDGRRKACKMLALHILANVGPVGRFGTRLRAKSTWRFGAYLTHSPAKCPTFNIIASAPELPA